MHPLYWLIPLLTALTGWLLVSLLIWLLFNPLKPVSLPGFRFQGILPGLQGSWARSVGVWADQELMSVTGLEEKATDPAVFERLKPLIDAHLDDFLHHRLGEKMPAVKMFIGEKTLSQLKATFMSELDTLFPVIMKNYIRNLKEDLNIGGLIETSISGISLEETQRKFKQNFHRQILSLKTAAFLFGLVIGVIQLLLVLLA